MVRTDELMEMFRKERDKTEESLKYSFEQFKRAEVKLEVINDMLDERRAQLAAMELVETATDGEVVDETTVETEVE